MANSHKLFSFLPVLVRTVNLEMINLEMANSHKLFSFLPVLVVRTVVRVLPTRWRNVHLVLHASVMGKNRESAMEISVSALFYPKLWVNM